MDEPAGVLQLQELIQRIINLSVFFAFFALTIVFFFAGVKFLMSRGEPKELASARQMIIWALLGMLFIALAWLVLMLVRTITGIDVTKFCIGFPGSPNSCF